MLSQDQVLDVFADSDLVLVPSLVDNYPNIFLEALATGCRVMCFASGGGGREVEEDAHPEAFSMVQLIDDSNAQAVGVIESMAPVHSAEREAFARHFFESTRSRNIIERYQTVYGP